MCRVTPCIGRQLWVATGALPADHHPVPPVAQQVVTRCWQEGHLGTFCGCRQGDCWHAGTKGAGQVGGDRDCGGFAELGVLTQPIHEPAVGIVSAVHLSLHHDVTLAVPAASAALKS